MAKILLKKAWPKFTDFQRKWHFSQLKSYLYRIFLAQIRYQRPKIDPCAKFHPNWTKAEGSRILTSNNSENSWLTSYARGSDDVIKILML